MIKTDIMHVLADAHHHDNLSNLTVKSIVDDLNTTPQHVASNIEHMDSVETVHSCTNRDRYRLVDCGLTYRSGSD